MESSKTSSSDPDASSSLSKLDSSSLDSSLSSSSSKERRGPCQQGRCCGTNCKASQQSITRERTVQRVKIIKDPDHTFCPQLAESCHGKNAVWGPSPLPADKILTSPLPPIACHAGLPSVKILLDFNNELPYLSVILYPLVTPLLLCYRLSFILAFIVEFYIFPTSKHHFSSHLDSLHGCSLARVMNNFPFSCRV